MKTDEDSGKILHSQRAEIVFLRFNATMFLHFSMQKHIIARAACDLHTNITREH